MSKATAENIEHSVVPIQQAVPKIMELVGRAIAEGDGKAVETLMAAQERWEKNEAKKAFDVAIALARAEFKPIKKNRHVGFDSRKPGAARTDYWHEDLAAVANAVDPILGKHGLSYRWRTSSPPNEPISVTCIVSHGMGHYEENTLSGPRDDTGNKNSIQQIGSTITYLQRYTLKAALGLAASNDDDGRAAGAEADATLPLTDDQAAKITGLVSKTKTDIANFLKWAQAESISDIQRGQFKDCVQMLERKLRQIGAKS